MLISLVGSQGAGKDATANILVRDHGFVSFAFADALKDCVAIIFNWSRDLLEGGSKESREWREIVDEWWAKELNIPHLTPRWVLQHFGTDVIRKNFHEDIWLLTVKRKILTIENKNIVTIGCRFDNEMNMITDLGGKIVRIKRGPNPIWWNSQLKLNDGESVDHSIFDNVHESERAWAKPKYDYVIENNSTFDCLENAAKNMLKHFSSK